MTRGGTRRELPQAAVMAGRSREVPLFPAALRALDTDPEWTAIATLVRDLTGDALDAGAYPVPEAACGDRGALVRLGERVFDSVAAEALRDGTAAHVLVLWRSATVPAGFPARDVDLAEGDRVANPSPELAGLLEDVCGLMQRLIEARLAVSPISTVDLTSWASQVGWTPREASGDRLIVLGDQVTSLVVSARGDLVVVERQEGRMPEEFVAAFPTVDDAVRLLILEIGSRWRAQERRTILRRNEVGHGCHLEEGPTATHLQWVGGSAEFPPGRTGRMSALDFSQVATASPRLVMASYRHPEGHPIFGS